MKGISEKTLLIILIALVVVLGVYINHEIVNRTNSLSNQVSRLSADIDDQSQQNSSLHAQIDTLLKEQASIIDSYSITYGAFNSGDMTYEVSFRVMPKESSADTTAIVSLGEVQIDMSRTDTSFSAVMDVPVGKDLNPTVTFYEDGNSRSETLADMVSFREHYVYEVKCGFSGEKSYRDQQIHYDGDMVIFSISPQGTAAESGRLLAEVNDEEIWTKEISINSEKESTVEFNESFPVGLGDAFALYLEIRGDTGMTYRYPVDSTCIAADGRSQSENYLPDECTVYDKDGNEILFD